MNGGESNAWGCCQPGNAQKMGGKMGRTEILGPVWLNFFTEENVRLDGMCTHTRLMDGINLSDLNVIFLKDKIKDKIIFSKILKNNSQILNSFKFHAYLNK